MLFFFAGYEIDFDRIKGRSLELAAIGWGISLILAYSVGGALAGAGIILSFLYTGSAMATTAIGTLIPILSDAGEMRTTFGTYLLGAGAIGEFGPIMLVTLILSTGHPIHEAVILVLFIVLAVLTGLLAVRSAWRGWPLVERTFETSSQLAVRLAVVLVFSLVALAAQLGLDLLARRIRCRDDHSRRAPRARGARLRLEADGRRLRPADPVLLRHQRNGVRPRRSHLQRDGDAEGADVRRLFLVVRGVPGAAPLPQAISPCATASRSASTRHGATAGRGDHDPGDRCRAT